MTDSEPRGVRERAVAPVTHGIQWEPDLATVIHTFFRPCHDREHVTGRDPLHAALRKSISSWSASHQGIDDDLQEPAHHHVYVPGPIQVRGRPSRPFDPPIHNLTYFSRAQM